MASALRSDERVMAEGDFGLANVHVIRKR